MYRLMNGSAVAAIAVAWGISGAAQANEMTAAVSADVNVVDALIVTGSQETAEAVGGSAVYLDEKALETFSYSDPLRLMRQVPGVYLQEEDGFGLRPNIGIRGSGSDRSGRVTLMEDGVLIAPAPYAAASAYYFPAVARMAGVEVVKGPAAIKYGPLTSGGAVQFFSTPIPETVGELGGKAQFVMGDYGQLRAHGAIGGWLPESGGVQFGALVEGLHDKSDGFKSLDSGGDTGFEIDDVVLKAGVRTAQGAAMPQSLQLKFERYDQLSDETYLGLTLADFQADPYRRYRASQLDLMDVEHETWQATHNIAFSDSLRLTTVAYRTETARAWYKLNDVLDDGSLRGIGTVLADPDAYPDAYDTLIGADGYVSPDDALRVRNNNRMYEATGVQSVLSAGFVTGPAAHRLEVSARWHTDEEDRFQQDDLYRMDDGRMVLTTAGEPGTQANRVAEAEAWAFFVRDTIDIGALTLTPGLRYETIELTRTDYAPGDAARTVPTSVRTSEVDVWIPGVSAVWRLNPQWRLIGGAHRGFSNPSPGSTTDPETSWNYEAGVRFDDGVAAFEAIAFFNDYDNLVGTCTASTGGGCDLGDQFDGGEVEVKGLEVTAGYDLGAKMQAPFAVPVSAIYTYTDAEFQTAFDSDYGPWGEVSPGFELPHLPEHQLTVNVGLHADGWRLDLTANRVGEARAVSGSGPIPADERIDERTLVDVAGEIEMVEGLSLFATVRNLTDEAYNVAFSPAGARPGAPRMALAGLKAKF